MENKYNWSDYIIGYKEYQQNGDIELDNKKSNMQAKIH